MAKGMIGQGQRPSDTEAKVLQSRVPGGYTGWEAVGLWGSEESSRIKETSN